MTIEFRMPALGADMTEGTLVEWRIAPGDPVKRGQVVALVETEKGIIDVESFHEGRVERLLVETGTHVPVGTALALFSGEAPQPASATAAAPAAAPVPGGGRVKISPAARRRAEELGLSIEELSRTGAGGPVSIADVEIAAAASKARPPALIALPASPIAPLAGAERTQATMRRAIAAAMTRAKREIPHYYLTQMIDFAPARAWLEQFNASRPVEDRLLYSVLIIKAVARAAAEIPGFSGFYRNGQFEAATDMHVGFAVAQRGGGLMAPALLSAASKDLIVLMHELMDLVARARGGHLRSSELGLPVITLTSLGDEGVDAVYPIIYPDQVAIVGAGRLTDRPWVSDGQVTIRPILTLTLAADHRVTDGRRGARFLARIATLLATPGEL
ncbi:MAG TPA: dihydrolipoamide acetyltransferase family protein [Steroidobacteraceae bacterium]|nr:dihydrolipoamide acetyltransferase family protein [Steroidobacteraceae bacterium]